MFRLVKLCIGTLVRLLRSRQGLLLENLALRQQLTVLKRRNPRPGLGNFDRLFWVIARRLWSGWKHSLILVTPETVVRWHRAGFRLYWKLVSRATGPVGRRPLSKEVRDLIFRMVAENPTWGAPRIHGELLMLGFEVSERTISRWMKRAPRNPAQAGVSPQSSGSHRSDGLLYSSHNQFRCALLPIRHWPRSTADSALQRYQAPGQQMDCAATAGSVSV